MNYKVEKICEKCGKQFLGSVNTKHSTCRSCVQKSATVKRQETCLQRYGVKNPSEKKEFVDKITETMKSRYGVKRAILVPEFRSKQEKTCLERHGNRYYIQSKEGIKSQNVRISSKNRKAKEILESIGLQVETEFVLDNYAYDLHIVDTNILIEIDPTYTHNSFYNHYNNHGIDSNYHVTKSIFAENNGFRCIHIFDWDDMEKILNIFSHKTKIHSRECKIVDNIEEQQLKSFLDENHIQGNCVGQSIKVGLEFNRELVQVMTFGEPKYNKKFSWELLRLCSKNAYLIVGGSNKLFKYCIKEYGLSNIVSCCDLSKSSGEVYEKIGFKLAAQSSPKPIWSKGCKCITSDLFIQQDYDQSFNTSEQEDKTKEQRMIESGWLPVYDCGQKVFTYDSKEKIELPPSEKLDVELVKKAKQYKICKFCGKEFLPANSFQKYCKGPHMRICPICGKEYEETNVENLKRPPHACSYPCRTKLRTKTSIERYGIVAPGNNPEARKKASETMMKKLGVPYAQMSMDVKNKSKATMISKYGVDNAMKVKEFVCKSMNTQKKRCGGVLAFNQPKIKEERKISSADKTSCLADYYKKPEVHTIINAEDLKLYRLNKDVSDNWMNEYYPLKAAKGTVLAIGLVRDDIIYCMMTFRKSRDKQYYAELSRMYSLPGYFIKSGYSVLSDFASEYGLCNIVSYVNPCFDNVEDYDEIGMKQIRCIQRKKWWWDGSNFISDASRRQSSWAVEDMINSRYSPYHDLGTAVYEFKSQ